MQVKNERYQRITDGMPTTADDPERGIWYSVKCSYWTDDWTKTKQHVHSPIPCCPVCLSPGFQTTAGAWEKGVAETEIANHPRYGEFIAAQKEHCAPGGCDLIKRYKEFAGQP